jgi:hypothetical protein
MSEIILTGDKEIRRLLVLQQRARGTHDFVLAGQEEVLEGR